MSRSTRRIVMMIFLFFCLQTRGQELYEEILESYNDFVGEERCIYCSDCNFCDSLHVFLHGNLINKTKSYLWHKKAESLWFNSTYKDKKKIKISRSFNQLDSLVYLIGNFGYTKRKLNFESDDGLQNLKYFGVTNYFFDSIPEFIYNSKNIQEISLWSNRDSPINFTKLSRLKNLKKIEIVNYSEIPTKIWSDSIYNIDLEYVSFYNSIPVVIDLTRLDKMKSLKYFMVNINDAEKADIVYQKYNKNKQHHDCIKDLVKTRKKSFIISNKQKINVKIDSLNNDTIKLHGIKFDCLDSTMVNNFIKTYLDTCQNSERIVSMVFEYKRKCSQREISMSQCADLNTSYYFSVSLDANGGVKKYNFSDTKRRRKLIYSGPFFYEFYEQY